MKNGVRKGKKDLKKIFSLIMNQNRLSKVALFMLSQGRVVVMIVKAMVRLIFYGILHIIYCSFAEILIFLNVAVMLFMLLVMQMNLEREALELRKEVMFLVPIPINLLWEILVQY